MRGIIATLIIFASSAVHASATELTCISQSSTIEAKLSCLNGVTFKETTNLDTPKGFKQIEMQFRQPIDHNNPKSGSFNQRVVLLHIDESEPMVLQTSGYSIFAVAQTTIAKMFETNQIQIEHRYFASSAPKTLDWTKLDIKQSADDFHAITTSLKQIYPARWVNTGASKGGMTSLYHRRYYPNDLDGTIADVAPLSFSTADARFNTFVENVGGATYKDCREDLKELQIQLLKNRTQLVPKIKGKFTHLGSADLAFEHSVIEAPFIFWQYGDPTDSLIGCDAIPVNGTPDQMFSFLQEINGVDGYTDTSLSEFMPYFYQSATQLGGPDSETSYLKKLMKYAFSVDLYTPKNVKYTYSNSTMLDIDQWVRTQGDDIIFIYGELDPWTAGEFPVSESGKRIQKYFVPQGNHSSKYVDLNNVEKNLVIETLKVWLNKNPVFARSASGMTLEDLEFKVRRNSHLP